MMEKESEYKSDRRACVSRDGMLPDTDVNARDPSALVSDDCRFSLSLLSLIYVTLPCNASSGLS